MSFKIWFILIFGLVNYPFPIRAEDEKKTCAAHEKWTVFQRRMNGNVDFFRGWDDYKKGFGDCDGDLWLGLEELHQLTKGDDMSLEINMMSKDKKDHLVARYSEFSIGPGSANYTLHVSGFSGNVDAHLYVDDAADAISYHNNSQFSTKDADHDDASWMNCASERKGGWWYHRCARSNLNGNFNKTDNKGIWWLDGYTAHHLCCSEMKVYKRLAVDHR